IGEVKRRSPSSPQLTAGGPIEVAEGYAGAGGAALLVVTQPPGFAGAIDDLRRVARPRALPVLRKDVLASVRHSAAAAGAGAGGGADAGAAAVLLIARALDDARLRDFAAAAAEYGLDVLVECHEEGEVERALALDGALVGVNNRDLATLEVDVARAARLLPRVPPERIAVAESGYA